MKYKISLVVFISVVLLFGHTQKVLALGLGQCHETGGGGAGLTGWSYGTGRNYGWRYLQPGMTTNPDYWRWGGIDADIDQAKAAGKKIWISMKDSGAAGYEVPRWAKETGVEQFSNLDTAACWNPEFLIYFEEALKVFAEKYDQPEYWDVIEAINIEGCGNYGEMGLKPNACSDKPGADVKNPDNVYVKSLAKTYGKTPLELTQINCRCGVSPSAAANCYCFDYYFIKSVNRIIDLYMKYFEHIPAVLQLGTGLSCQGIVYVEAARYANCAYGQQVWTKYNGWGPNFIPVYNGNPAYTRIGYEVGDQNNFSKTKWKDIYCPAAGIAPAACEGHIRSIIDGLITNTVDGSSFLCLQSDFFKNPNEYYLADYFSEIRTNLAKAPTPGPTRTDCENLVRPDPLPTESPNISPVPSMPYPPPPYQYNLDLDELEQINQEDLNIFMDYWEKTASHILRADFNKDGRINETDLTALLKNWVNAITLNHTPIVKQLGTLDETNSHFLEFKVSTNTIIKQISLYLENYGTGQKIARCYLINQATGQTIPQSEKNIFVPGKSSLPNPDWRFALYDDLPQLKLTADQAYRLYCKSDGMLNWNNRNPMGKEVILKGFSM